MNLQAEILNKSRDLENTLETYRKLKKWLISNNRPGSFFLIFFHPKNWALRNTVCIALYIKIAADPPANLISVYLAVDIVSFVGDDWRVQNYKLIKISWWRCKVQFWTISTELRILSPLQQASRWVQDFFSGSAMKFFFLLNYGINNSVLWFEFRAELQFISS